MLKRPVPIHNAPWRNRAERTPERSLSSLDAPTAPRARLSVCHRVRGFAFGQQAFALVGMVVVFMRQHPPEVEATQARERASQVFVDEHALGGSPPSSPHQAPAEPSIDVRTLKL